MAGIHLSGRTLPSIQQALGINYSTSMTIMHTYTHMHHGIMRGTILGEGTGAMVETGRQGNMTKYE